MVFLVATLSLPAGRSTRPRLSASQSAQMAEAEWVRGGQ